MGYQASIVEAAQGHSAMAEGLRKRADLLEQISDFLLRHDLAVTADNLLRAHAIMAGGDRRLERAVAKEEAAGNLITQQFLDEHAKPRNASEEAVEQLRSLSIALDRSVLQFGEYTRSAQEAASNYGNELQRSVDAASFSQDSGIPLSEDILADFTRVARVMLERTNEIEERMKKGEQEAAQLREKLQKAQAEASVDPLTGLPNRRAFQEVFDREAAAARESGRPLTVAICDIDLFKKVNDTHGHETGDRVICAVGQALDTISDTCHVARHGGEEFVLLFCGQDVASASRTLDASREHLSRKRFVDKATRKPIGSVTFSGGVADALGYAGLGDAMRAADEALYRAKETGRNRIERERAG